jgi:hypothetical protein
MVECEEKRRTLSHAPHPGMTLKSGAPCVKATSRSSTARPQEKTSLMVRSAAKLHVSTIL